MSIKPALEKWGTSKKFAVAGASNDTEKFGYKVYDWYLSKGLPVIPLHHKLPTIEVRGTLYNTRKSPAALDSPQDYALSIITAPHVTQGILEEANKVGIRAVWLQPGTFDDKVLAYAKSKWPDATIAGFDDRALLMGGEGWCVLVDGENALNIAGRQGKI